MQRGEGGKQTNGSALELHFTPDAQLGACTGIGHHPSSRARVHREVTHGKGGGRGLRNIGTGGGAVVPR